MPPNSLGSPTAPVYPRRRDAADPLLQANSIAPVSPSLGVPRPQAGARRRRAIDTLQTSLFFALLAGLTEAGSILAWSHILGRFAWVSRDQLWMAPLAYALLFAPLAGMLAIVEAVLPRRVPRFAATYVFAFAAFFSLTLPFGQLSHYATVLLAWGLAAVVGRFVAGHAAGYLRTVRVGSLVLLALVGLLAWVLPAARRRAEERALAGVPAAQAGARNVLLLILDTVRASSLQLYGFEQPNTPGLVRDARAGIVFTQAFSTAPWTLASHASVFTGHLAREFDVDLKHPFHQPYPTLAATFRDAGYATGGFVANHDYTSYDSGLNRGFDHYEDYVRSARELFASAAPGQTELFRTLWRARGIREVARALRHPDLGIPPTRWSQPKPAEVVNREFLSWTRGLHGRPFFAFLNYYDAHYPYHCPAPYAARFRCRQSERNAYAGAIAYLDAQITLLLQEMQARGLLGNTIVVITSDHGEHFGEHGLEGHGNSLYLSLLHVPLVILGTDVPGARIDSPVSLRDLPATLAEVAGIRGRAQTFPAASLMRLVRRGRTLTPPVSEPVQSSYGMHGFREADRSEIGPRFHRILAAGREEVYDYVVDPDETRNLTASSIPVAGQRGSRPAASATTRRRTDM